MSLTPEQVERMLENCIADNRSLQHDLTAAYRRIEELEAENKKLVGLVRIMDDMDSWIGEQAGAAEYRLPDEWDEPPPLEES